MLLALWPLFLMDDVLAVDTPELNLFLPEDEIVVVSVDTGEMLVKDT